MGDWISRKRQLDPHLYQDSEEHLAWKGGLSSVSTDGSAVLWRPGPSYAPWSSSPLCLSVLSSRQRQPLLQPKLQPAPQSITPQKEQKLPWASLLVGTRGGPLVARSPSLPGKFVPLCVNSRLGSPGFLSCQRH